MKRVIWVSFIIVLFCSGLSIFAAVNKCICDVPKLTGQKNGWANFVYDRYNYRLEEACKNAKNAYKDGTVKFQIGKMTYWAYCNGKIYGSYIGGGGGVTENYIVYPDGSVCWSYKVVNTGTVLHCIHVDPSGYGTLDRNCPQECQP